MSEQTRWDEIWAKKRTVGGPFAALKGKDIIYKTVLDILTQEVSEPSGKRILEAGCGSGLVSLELARRGADVFLIDISPQALFLAHENFHSQGIGATMLLASVTDLPFEDNSFDVTWNAGVIEHFDHDGQIRAVREMLRVTKPEGSVIVIVPSAAASVYRFAKSFADKHNLWQPGYEQPILSLKELGKASGGSVVREYRTGFIAQFHFLKYLFWKVTPLRLGWCGLVELAGLLRPLNRLPGYLLVAVIKKTG